MNPINLALQILTTVAAALAKQAAPIVAEAGISITKIVARITEIAVDTATGKIKPQAAVSLLEDQYDLMRVTIDVAIGEGEIQAEQLGSDVASAVKSVIFGSIGHLL